MRHRPRASSRVRRCGPGPLLFPSPALGSEPDPVSGFGLRGPFFTPGGSENSVTAASPCRALQTPRGHTAAVRRARRLMPRPPGVVHGPRDAERQRGYRLTTGQVVHLLQHLNAEADGAQWYQVPLGELAAILAAAHRRKSHAALDGCDDGIWPLSVALRWRAGLLLQLPGAPRLQLWTHSAVAEWNPAFKAGVRRVWKQLARMRNGSRRPAGGGAPATTQRRSGPRAHPRANGIGMLQNEFPDTAIKSLVRGARRRIPSWHPPRVELPSDALSALLAAGRASEVGRACSPPEEQLHPQQVQQAARVRGWRLKRAVEPTCPAVFAISAASDAIRCWRESAPHKGPTAIPPVAVIRSFLSKTRHVLPTPLCSPTGETTHRGDTPRVMDSDRPHTPSRSRRPAAAGHLWDAAAGRPLTLQQYAAVLQKEPWLHALESVVSQGAVTPSQMRSLLGAPPAVPHILRSQHLAVDPWPPALPTARQPQPSRLRRPRRSHCLDGAGPCAHADTHRRCSVECAEDDCVALQRDRRHGSSGRARARSAQDVDGGRVRNCTARAGGCGQTRSCVADMTSQDGPVVCCVHRESSGRPLASPRMTASTGRRIPASRAVLGEWMWSCSPCAVHPSRSRTGASLAAAGPRSESSRP